MPGGVDLHTHTTASDGTLAPRALVREAARRGVRVLAITDHDSTDGLAEAAAEAAAWPPLELVPGIEINCDAELGEVHILGYFMDCDAGWFQDFCRAQREARRARVRRMAERLASLGLPVDPEEILALVSEGSAGRPHVAQAMVRRGYVRSPREAFDRYLAKGKPAHVPRERLAPAEAVRLIRRAAGVPVLAHPGLGVEDTMVHELIGAGLMGIECIYREHSAAQTAHYLDLCRRRGLVATGGSDFHGPGISPATLGSPPVPLRAVEVLRAKAAEVRAAR